jgi:hypothetical protein
VPPLHDVRMSKPDQTNEPCTLQRALPGSENRATTGGDHARLRNLAKCRKTLTAVRDAAVRDHSVCRPITSIRLAAFVNMSSSATAGSKGEH